MFIDEYLDWFHHVTGRVISLATMWRTIIRLGFTHKKVYTLSAVYFLLAKNQENEKLTFRNNWQIRHVFDVTAHARPGYIACRKTTSKGGCRKISAVHVTLKRAVIDLTTLGRARFDPGPKPLPRPCRITKSQGILQSILNSPCHHFNFVTSWVEIAEVYNL